MTRMERWLAYFSNKLNTEEMEELIMSDAAIKNAVNDTGIFMQDIEERLNISTDKWLLWTTIPI